MRRPDRSPAGDARPCHSGPPRTGCRGAGKHLRLAPEAPMARPDRRGAWTSPRLDGLEPCARFMARPRYPRRLPAPGVPVWHSPPTTTQATTRRHRHGPAHDNDNRTTTTTRTTTRQHRHRPPHDNTDTDHHTTTATGRPRAHKRLATRQTTTTQTRTTTRHQGR